MQRLGLIFAGAMALVGLSMIAAALSAAVLHLPILLAGAALLSLGVIVGVLPFILNRISARAEAGNQQAAKVGRKVAGLLAAEGIQVPKDVMFVVNGDLPRHGRTMQTLTAFTAFSRAGGLQRVLVNPALLLPENAPVLAGALAQQLAKEYGNKTDRAELYTLGRTVVEKLGLSAEDYAKSQRIKVGLVSPHSRQGGLAEYVNHMLNAYAPLVKDGVIEVEVFAHDTDIMDKTLAQEMLSKGQIAAILGPAKSETEVIVQLKIESVREVKVAVPGGAPVTVPIQFHRVTRFNDSTSIARLARAVIKQGVDIVNFQWLLSSADDSPKGLLGSFAPAVLQRMLDIPTTVTMHHTVHTMDLEAARKVSGLVSKMKVMAGSELIERTLQLDDQVYLNLNRYLDAYRDIYDVDAHRMHHGYFQLTPIKEDRYGSKTFETQKPVFIGSVGKWGDYKLVEDQVSGLQEMFRKNPDLAEKAIGLLGGGDNPNALGYTARTEKYYRDHPEEGVLVITGGEVAEAIRKADLAINKPDGYRLWIAERARQARMNIVYRAGFIENDEFGPLNDAYDLALLLYLLPRPEPRARRTRRRASAGRRSWPRCRNNATTTWAIWPKMASWSTEFPPSSPGVPNGKKFWCPMPKPAATCWPDWCGTRRNAMPRPRRIMRPARI